MEGESAHQLDVVWDHVPGHLMADDWPALAAFGETATCFPDCSEGFHLQIVDRFTVGEALAKLGRLAAELIVAQPFILRAESLDLVDDGSELLEVALRLTFENFSSHRSIFFVKFGQHAVPEEPNKNRKLWDKKLRSRSPKWLPRILFNFYML